MNEVNLQWLIILKMLGVVLCAGLYAWGGMKGKWRRRYVAPCVAGGLMLIPSLEWIHLVSVPLLIGASTIGYGGTSLWGKIRRRSISGGAFGLAVAMPHLIQGNYLIAGLSFITLLSYMVCLGVWNPFKDARTEESTIGLMIYAWAIMPT